MINKKTFNPATTSVVCLISICLSVGILLTGCASTQPSRYHSTRKYRTQFGMASWYGGKFDGRKTASGEVFSKSGFSAAHRKLPFGTVVRVINRNNGRHITVRINDRGPFKPGRIIDLSEAAAKRIGLFKTGVAPVRVEILHIPPNP